MADQDESGEPKSGGKKKGKRPPAPPPPDLASQIKALSQKSGRPLEVEVAQSFLKAPRIEDVDEQDGRNDWQVFLSSYFLDRGKVRELDVLARRRRSIELGNTTICSTLEVFVSCRGFPKEEHPIAFTVPSNFARREQPMVMVEFHPARKRETLRWSISKSLLDHLQQGRPHVSGPRRRTIGFDIYSPRSPQKPELKAVGDERIYEGIDSALRSSFYWAGIDLPPFFQMEELRLRVQICVLVLSRPWHEVPIDGGVVGDPIVRDVGFITHLYPLTVGPQHPVPIFVLLIAKERLQDLQGALLAIDEDLITQAREIFRQPE